MLATTAQVSQLPRRHLTLMLDRSAPLDTTVRLEQPSRRTAHLDWPAQARACHSLMPSFQPTSAHQATTVSRLPRRRTQAVTLAPSALLGTTVRAQTPRQVTPQARTRLTHAHLAPTVRARVLHSLLTARPALQATTVSTMVPRIQSCAPRAGTVRTTAPQVKSLRCHSTSSAPWATIAHRVRSSNAPLASSRTRLGRARAKHARPATSAPSSTPPTIYKPRLRKSADRTTTARTAQTRELLAQLGSTL